MGRTVVMALAALAIHMPCMAQDLVLHNARVIDGTGRLIERGAIEIVDGLIRSVSEQTDGSPEPIGLDVQGMTVMPGLIDAHRHDLLGSLQSFSLLENEEDVQEAINRETPQALGQLLAEGFTTVMMPGMYLSAAQEVRSRLASGAIRGPRLLFSGPGLTAQDDFPVRGVVCQGNAFCSARVAFQITDPEAAREHVRFLANEGVDAIKVFLDNVGNDLDDPTLAAIVEEARAVDLPVMLHAHSAALMMRGLGAGFRRFVHTPSDVLLEGGPVGAALRTANAMVVSAVSQSTPEFAEVIGFDYAEAGHERILSNIGSLIGEDVGLAFGTDSPDLLRPMLEVEELAKVLKAEEIIAALTRNAATFLGREDELGTLEAGKIGDMVVIDGDPIARASDISRIVLVIQEGRVVVDRR